MKCVFKRSLMCPILRTQLPESRNSKVKTLTNKLSPSENSLTQYISGYWEQISVCTWAKSSQEMRKTFTDMLLRLFNNACRILQYWCIIKGPNKGSSKFWRVWERYFTQAHVSIIWLTINKISNVFVKETVDRDTLFKRVHKMT